MLSQMTVSEMMATIDVKMSMDKYSFQSITMQTERVVRPPQTPKILDTLVGGAIYGKQLVAIGLGQTSREAA